MDKAKKFAEERGMTIISAIPFKKEASNIRFIRVRCEEGHEWEPSVSSMARGHGCAQCNGNAKHTLADMAKIATGRGGELVSIKYDGLTKHLTWRCEQGHQWDATPNNVKNHGSWCKDCVFNVGEELTRAAVEEAFACLGALGRFDRTRALPWLENKELDGYNETIKMAFEYNGIQHYESVDHYGGDDALVSQKIRDERKEVLCRENCVLLIVTPHTVKFSDIRDYVRKQLTDWGYPIEPKQGTDQEFYDSIRKKNPRKDHMLERARAAIMERGGELVSESYVGYKIPLNFTCSKGTPAEHESSATPEAIEQAIYRKTGICSMCSPTRLKNDDEVAESVAAAGYVFIRSETREGSGGRKRRYYVVKCPAGHEEYPVEASNWMAGKKCASCKVGAGGAARRNDQEQIERILGMKCLGVYKTNSIKYEWQCPAGHLCNASYAALRMRKVKCKLCA